ncbi:PleD family two-component system response regulator [Sphingobacterium mizutaii]|uniref:response regulator n=1 Tax=Sphingobacterium mizutaii TaxID=1010 RepID=UPI00162743D8|nr:response regulator [Sphingobacterium mizutaii]
MVFEDDPILMEVYELVLENMGFQVHSSSTSHDVIEKVERHHPDLILMDNWTPNIGGVQATRLLKGDPRFSKIPVIYISANTEVHILADNAGADTYLLKPFDLEDLEEKILDLGIRLD